MHPANAFAPVPASSRYVHLAGQTLLRDLNIFSEAEAYPTLSENVMWRNRTMVASPMNELSVNEVINDPLIAMLNQADGIDSRAFAQLIQSASRVIDVRGSRA
ncbi:hypothetical protein [Rhizobium sp. 16-488-2b]|uniref:hypothetical protein n=1 Tax=Rhizobium sp. 16-488-2b TaxID=2819991 RepID=UPI001ADA3918|nr:hypothetical protein [Rhizobium sp. 16-488-2b]